MTPRRVTTARFGVLLDGLKHRQRGVTGPHGVIFVGDGCPEHRHQAVALQATDGAFVAMHGVHHDLDRPIQETLGVLGIAISDQFGGANDVSEQDSDVLALTLEGVAAG